MSTLSLVSSAFSSTHLANASLLDAFVGHTQELAEVLREYPDVYVLWDEIYEVCSVSPCVLGSPAGVRC